MTLPNTFLIRKLTLFLAAAMLSVSAMAADFNQIQRLANQGNATAQVKLGMFYYKGEGVRQDYAKAREWYERSANQGNPLAQGVLGLIYYHGEGVRQDHSKAFELFQKSANQGDATAQGMLGMLYYKGEGVRQDYAKAVDGMKNLLIKVKLSLNTI